ncbi:hypothetical protein SNEBB_003144 [Seison nebaliae]|nr:hypothetical protein SNEBB_003144 [Seison nebaliae]
MRYLLNCLTILLFLIVTRNGFGTVSIHQSNANENELIDYLKLLLSDSFDGEPNESNDDSSLRHFVNQERRVMNNFYGDVQVPKVEVRAKSEKVGKEDESKFSADYEINREKLQLSAPSPNLIRKYIINLQEGDPSIFNNLKIGEPQKRVQNVASKHWWEEDVDGERSTNYGIIAAVVGCATLGLVGIVMATTFYYKSYRQNEESKTSEYMGGQLSNNLLGDRPVHASNSGGINAIDRKLAQSAQMYHYQHQKQQMLALERGNNDEFDSNNAMLGMQAPHPIQDISDHSDEDDDDDDDGENERDGDYTVYECPGLAPTGELEVRNPVFSSMKRTSSSSNNSSNNSSTHSFASTSSTKKLPSKSENEMSGTNLTTTIP